MNVDDILNIIKSVPSDKWNDDETIKDIIKTAAEQSSRSYSEEELQKHVENFKSFAGDGSAFSMIPMLLKKGIGKNQLDDIIEKLKNQ